VRWGVFLGIAAAVPALVYFWGFTVDDALIPARYATHLARGLGYRFNADGPSTDGVTPLGWPYLLVPFAKSGPLGALQAARVLGAVAWLGASGALGASIARVPGGPWRFAALAIVLLSPSLGAWASAGLETGAVVALATLAAVLPAEPAFSRSGAALAGACAWLRPEMIAYAALLGWGRGRLAKTTRDRVLCALFAFAPWFAAAAIRGLAWGRPAPLAVLSKPPAAMLGGVYALGAFALSGAFVAVLAPLAFRRLPFFPRVLVVAAFAHLAVVAIAGGDWMPLARLAAPVLPPLVLVAAHLLADSAWPLVARLRLALACAGEIAVLAMRGPAARRVLADRLVLVETARPVLAGATRVATLDVGWVGAAFEGNVIDLAGATDLEIASLAGGHTTKAISGAFLTGRDPDRLVLELTATPNGGPRFLRGVEIALAADPLVRRAYRTVWTSPDTLPIKYEILSKTPASPPTLDGPTAD
jgi:hypothetical protein